MLLTANRSTDKKIRIRNILFISALILFFLLIVLLGVLTNHRVPCLFHMFTGLDCPGCGMTRAVVSLYYGRFIEAFNYNPFVYILISFIPISIPESIRYIETGMFSKTFEKILLFLGLALITFGILRNIL